jgi:hypothetical protein
VSQIRVELLSRLRFASAFPDASLSYSRTPWVQRAALFGSAATNVGTFPILISKNEKTVGVFFYDGSWKSLNKSRRKELDPVGLLAQIRRTIEA